MPRAANSLTDAASASRLPLANPYNAYDSPDKISRGTSKKAKIKLISLSLLKDSVLPKEEALSLSYNTLIASEGMYF